LLSIVRQSGLAIKYEAAGRGEIRRFPHSARLPSATIPEILLQIKIGIRKIDPEVFFPQMNTDRHR
jgi:hypothetical protein